ncbi:unnamed protein product [Didymodactylos carnosus]|uniref:DED domain-containing protein n=1 Tax=Didymodactylos carnosus TaxID=1234261 RepID=A0A815AC60_9BILA|nr:unnamed protein product [Didymodactylos carnosus]CAF1253670.1 unnamed protein product [Didymodactylos carnosus]CAF3965329.1 unnamed protein product [Didymodactylos carnosus]CAF4024673.1 unnamed protein product [Didymodactylos carnosus]
MSMPSTTTTTPQCMEESIDFRAVLLKIQEDLSNDDRRKLHFLFGENIPRRLRDDPSVGGTLSLLESLFDHAKISNDDFMYLIKAFDKIGCEAAAKRLKAHRQQSEQKWQTLDEDRPSSYSLMDEAMKAIQGDIIVTNATVHEHLLNSQDDTKHKKQPDLILSTQKLAAVNRRRKSALLSLLKRHCRCLVFAIAALAVISILIAVIINLKKTRDDYRAASLKLKSGMYRRASYRFI